MLCRPYSLRGVVRVIKPGRVIGGQAAHTGKLKSSYTILIEKPEWKRPLGRHGHRWKDNINMHFKDVSCEGADYIHIAQVKGPL